MGTFELKDIQRGLIVCRDVVNANERGHSLCMIGYSPFDYPTAVPEKKTIA